MKDKSTKRIENKKKKMAALLEITKLNENDRIVKKAQTNDSNTAELEPRCKRPRTETPTKKSTDLPSQIGESELGPSGKPKLTGEDLAKLKKMLRERTLKIRQSPHFRLRDMGENASVSVDPENRVPLFLSDIQHLIMYSQLGAYASYTPSRWCNVEKVGRLASCNVLIIENLTLPHFQAHESAFPFLNSQFEHKLEILTPHSYNCDVVQDLSMVPLSGQQMRKFLDEYGTLEDAVVKSSEVFDTMRNLFPIDKNDSEEPATTSPDLPPTDRFPRTLLLLSGWQLVEENFPLPIKGLMETKYPGYVLTKDKYENVTPFSPMFGIDCEMCKTTTGDLELTRVSVVNEDLSTFYDTLVKPDNRITDYLTRFSGITPKMMRNVTKRLQDVQEDLRRLLPADAILVGQSLSNDMHALKMMHPYVIDSSVIFNLTGDRSRKTKLKTLVLEFLSENIQEGSGGHCSTEDSIGSLKLVQLKLRKNLHFGDAVMGNIENEVRLYPELGTFNYATSMIKQSTKFEKTASVVGLADIVTKYIYYIDKSTKAKVEDKKIQCTPAKSYKEVVKKLCESMSAFSLNIGHVKIQDSHLESTKVLKNIDKWVKQVYEASVAPGLVVVVFVGSAKGNGCCFIQIKKDI